MELPEIPKNRDITYLGLTSFRDKNQLFGIKRKDRRQHVYILGKSGTGKSALMFNMIVQNIQNGEGVCVVDPHGELVEGVLSAIPPERMKDVVYFNPADTDYHIGFNVLELIDPQYKHLVASGLMGIFTKIWANAWSARMEYILNNCILALLDTPGTTLLGIPRMLVDKDYRQKIISNLKDPVIKAFWVHEYEAWQDKFRNEAIAPIQNKVGQFLSTSIIRNVVGQSVSTINIFDIMNDGKIFLVNVSKGRIGEDNSGLLGGMIITKIQLAAMERVRIPEEYRKDFYLYVDEFQNFVTDAFAGILSEARKYRLNLTVAHQYTAQLISDKSSAVRDAVFGNVGTMIVFRVGSDDADFLEKEFDPEFTPSDIVNLPNYKIYLKLMIDGVTSRPFSARTLPPIVKSGNKKIEEEVIKSSRDLYCRPREAVEREINNWSGMSLGNYPDTNGNGNLEKFPVICSLCKLEKTVPFKPEPGRAVYCKECIAKIKSGEVKVEKRGQDQIKYDESKFYKPLADLGIEFKQKNGGVEEEHRYQERGEKDIALASKPSVFKSIKKVFTKKVPVKVKPVYPARISGAPVKRVNGDNSALREVLNKVVVEETKSTPTPVSTPTPISLDSLKNKMQASPIGGLQPREVKKPVSPIGVDRAATPENMNKLKDLITKKITTPAEALPDRQAGTPPSQGGEETPQKPKTPASPVGGLQPREVPEDVLRKILE
ncbi:MAG: type IV secretion system DNA-binding domain-containing protein [Candidatus Pacebacteria bacterium]|nr:type IV secretion system DNA-binding domain-containing protein [Candidatus Paceibacterota bacterium]